MQLFALGINHHTAPLAVREQVSFDLARLPLALHDLLRAKPVREAAILSTCNRTELYCAAEQPEAAVEWLAEYHALTPRPHPALPLHASAARRRAAHVSRRLRP